MLMRKISLGALFALALFASSAVAGVVDKKAALGGYDGFVERMGAGTRELGRGNTGSADTSAMPGAYWNPAILGFRQNFNYTLNAERRSLDRTGGSLGLETSVGNRMGIGFAMLYRGDIDFEVIDEDAQTLGSATPFFSMMYLGWLRQWNEKWSSSVVIRNISFSKNLSARWTRSPSSDNRIPSTEGVRPKVLQVGLGYRSKIMGKPVYAWMEALDYQVADTLLVFDPQHHVWTGRVGFECEIIPAGTVRIGMDDLNAMLGLGYKFDVRIGKKRYLFDVNYALTYESSAGLFNPLSFGVRGFIP